MINNEAMPTLSFDENGLFDIEDEAILAEIAGGLSESVAVLDNGCVHNKSECGKTSPTPTAS